MTKSEALRDLDREILRAEKAYHRTLRRRRCEGVEAAGSLLHRLYNRRRRLQEERS